MKKVKLEKKTRRNLDQGTVVLQTSSFTTSKDYGYLLLCRLPLPKTSIFKIRETFLHHGSANHCTVDDEFAGHTERSKENTVHNTSVKVALSLVDCIRAMKSFDNDDSLTESIFVSKT